ALAWNCPGCDSIWTRHFPRHDAHLAPDSGRSPQANRRRFRPGGADGTLFAPFKTGKLRRISHPYPSTPKQVIPLPAYPRSVRPAPLAHLSQVTTHSLQEVSPVFNSPDELAQATVLAVDDDPDGRYSLAQILRHRGFQVWEAASGAEALRLARQKPDI